MNSVKILPESLVNKIAAGEVIERPASVIKELLENSLDARSGRVTIEVEDSGHKLIRITDNGHGMSPEDIRLAVQQHATSKISELDDLFNIKTFGFRGEALASIASISHFQITSRSPENTMGHRLIIEGGKILEDKSAACAPGTIIEVRNIFFNTPARRKFQKSKSAEMSAINEMITRIAIPHSDVEFRVIRDGRETSHLSPVDSRKERIKQLFGNELYKELIEVHHEAPQFIINGFVSSVNYTRGNSRWQYSFLNNRFIKDSTISAAITEGYGVALPSRRYGVTFMFIEANEEEFDVNVHPTKQEVRFRDTKSIFHGIYSGIRESLESKQIIPTAIAENKLSPQIDSPRKNSINKSIMQFFEDGVSTRKPPKPVSTKNYSYPTSKKQERQPEFEFAGGEIYSNELNLQELKYVATLFNNYLLFETGDGFLLVDQHALHERIIYNQLISQNTKKYETQQMLIPELLEVAPGDIPLLKETIPLLNEIGFEVESFGENTIAIQGVPDIMKDKNLKDFIRDFLSSIEDGEKALNNRRDVLYKRLACHGAVRAGQQLKPDEVESLIADFYTLKPPYTCPHGRPALITFTKFEIEKMFKRK